jgi:hypothetical protein
MAEHIKMILFVKNESAENWSPLLKFFSIIRIKIGQVIL